MSRILGERERGLKCVPDCISSFGHTPLWWGGLCPRILARVRTCRGTPETRVPAQINGSSWRLALFVEWYKEGGKVDNERNGLSSRLIKYGALRISSVILLYGC